MLTASNAYEHSRIKQHNAQHKFDFEQETNSSEQTVNLLTSPRLPAHNVNVDVNGHNLQLELDIEYANTVVSKCVWRLLGALNLLTAPQVTA